MVAVGLEDGAEVQGGHPQLLQIGQFLLDALETAAEEVPVADLPVLVGEVLHQLLPVLVDHPVPQHPCGIGDEGAVKAVREDLVGDPLAEPLGGGQLVVVNGLLPAGGLAVAAQTVFSQPDLRAVLPGKAEAIPDQLRLLRSTVPEREGGAVARFRLGVSGMRGLDGVLCVGGGEGKLLPHIGKFPV